ncbi:hypothetical protein B0H14DRAFT_2704646 [Mycena olivaceomarginata]|nr:hypothetical protein B0H14DRAFT_2704646 [Mycena olivaceomarginata]
MAACVGSTPHRALGAGSAKDGPSHPSSGAECVPLLPRRPAPCAWTGVCPSVPACPDLQSDRSEAPLTGDDGWVEGSLVSVWAHPSSHSKQTKWRNDTCCTSLAVHPQSICWWCALSLSLPFVPPRLSFTLILRLSSIATADSAARAFLSRIPTYKTLFHPSSRSKFCKALMAFLVVLPSRAW